MKIQGGHGPCLPPAADAHDTNTIVGKRDFKNNYNPIIPSRNYNNFITAYDSAKLLKTNLNFI